MKRILLVGLDGASPYLVQAWRESLPNLDALIREGASGTLQSTIPPRSVPAWYSFVTGANPAKLGVFGFSQRRPATYDYTFANFSYCRARPFWEWLDSANVPCAVIHVPGTFPPRKLNGVMVSGWPMPLNRGNLIYTYPSWLSRKIDSGLPAPFEAVSPHSITPDNDELMLHERLRILQMHGDVAYRLLQEHEWQLALVVLSPLDRASHQFWRHIDVGHPHHDAKSAPNMNSALKHVYEATDKQLGRLLELIDDRDYVFVVSDHGFGPCHRSFYLNEWLLRNGYLVLQDERTAGSLSMGALFLARLTTPLFRLNDRSPLFRRLSGPLKKRAISNFVRDRYVRASGAGRVRLNHLPVDWTRTRAYCPDESSLYLNLRGRDPQGIVAPGQEASHLLDELEERLQDIRDPHTGQKVSVDVWRKENIYSGPFLREAPELTVTMDNYRTNVFAELGHGEIFDDKPLWSGNHTPEGLLIARGPDIRAGQQSDAEIVDLAPTILHLMNAPVPIDIDGSVIMDLFEPDSAYYLREVRFEDLPLHDGSTHDLSPDEETEVAKQLKDLGYIE